MTPVIFKKFPLLELSALVVAILVFIGWQFDVQIFDSEMMSRAAAVTFIICIASKLLFNLSAGNKKLLLPAKILAVCTVLIAALRIIAMFSAPNQLDDLFLFQKGQEGVNIAFNTMTLVTAVCFVLLGVALYSITIDREKILLPQTLSVAVFSIALLSSLAYLFHENTFHQIPFYKPMGLGAAINFLLLSVSILLVNKRKGFIGDISSPYQGGKIARLLIPMAIIVPVVLGFFQLQMANNRYGHPYDIALLTLGRILVLVLFIWRTAVIINRSSKALISEIEERKKNEEVLRYRKALLEAQKEAIPDAVLVLDKKGNILTHNRRFAELWNIPQEIIDEKNDAAALEFAMKQLEDPQGFLKRVSDIYSHPEETAHDEIVLKDGRIIERYANAVVGDDGTKYGWAWYFRDITLNRRYENEIKNFNKYLEIKVRERTEKLNKSEIRFRLLVENSSDVISLLDANGRIVYMSPSIKRLTGFAEEELLGRQGFEIFHKDDLENGKRMKAYMLENPGITIYFSFRFLCKDGGYIWVEGTGTNMLNNENVNAFLLNYRDITERKKGEEIIQKSEKRFRTLVENAEDIISLSDENGIRFYMSPAIERITGFSPEETINQHVFNIVYHEDLEKAKLLRAGFTEDPGVLKPVSLRFKKKDGGFVWLEGTLINLLHDDNVKAIVGNFHDVTERKINEERIRITNERFEMVSKATNDAIWDWDLDTDEISWNEEIKSMFQYCAEDIATGTEWKNHIHPEDFKRVTKKIIYHVKNRIQKWQDEYRFRCADGSYKYIFNRGFILFNNDNKPYRIIGAMQDVTQLNKLQQSLNEERIKKQIELTNATIEGQEKERTEIGKELHDNINQLITGTKLYLDVAIKQPSLKDEMIQRSVQNLSVCMEEIRRLSSALVPPSIGVSSLKEIVQDLLEPIRLATSISVKYEIDHIEDNVLTNEQQLNVYRIIQEHLNNILKHSRANNVFIGVKNPDNNQVEITIKDDGQGFDMAIRRKGIGFKNIQSRAELLNGKMNLISKPGGGCLLRVNFPLNHSAYLIN